jgi:hypothetical protein
MVNSATSGFRASGLAGSWLVPDGRTHLGVSEIEPV